MPDPPPGPESFEETITRLRQVAADRRLMPEEVLHLVFGTQGAGRPAAPGAIRDVGRYLLVEEMGRGGMGVVYRARDKSLGREVAIKVLSAEGVPDEALDRFQREARAAAALDHPHIVKVLDVGELPPEDGASRKRPFYAMELLHGEDLAHAIGANSVSPRLAAQVVRQIAEALAFAHQKGIFHRDVKPANIWLLRQAAQAPSPDASAAGMGPATAPAGGHRARPYGEDAIHAVLLDFGLARLLDKGVSPTTATEVPGRFLTLTETGQLLGTPVYMSPEQVGGAHDVDGRADVYSLGATLYHALTGRPPFTGVSLSILLDAVRREDPVPPRRLSRAVPRDLETICLKCLAKEPSRRYATAADLVEDCRHFLAGEPLLARPPGPAERGARWARRRPFRALGIAAAILVVAGLAFRYFGPARIALVADPTDARVTVNGRPYGDGHWIWPWGSLLVRVEADGYETKEFVVEIAPATHVDIGTVVLVRDSGSIEVTSDPPGAEVVIDGAPAGTRTPAAIDRVRNGLHRLELRWPDGTARRDVFIARPGQTTSVRVSR